MDDLDLSTMCWEFMQEAFVKNELERIRLLESERVLLIPVCEHCEENPVKRTAVGVYCRYCERCAAELYPEKK